MNKNKYRIYDYCEKRFLPYSCWLNSFDFNEFMAFDRYFECHKEKCAVQQFIGILDKNLKEIYERDVVKGVYGLEGIKVFGEVRYSCDRCAYLIGDYEISNMEFDSLEIVGNMDQDYIYNENGDLIKYERPD